MIRKFPVNWKAFAEKRIRARFYTARVEKNLGFSQRKSAHVYSPVFHSARFLGSQPPVEIFSAYALRYRHALILDVISRILSCKTALPSCKAVSTLRMA